VRLSPRRTRDWAASRYDLRGMVSAYEWLLLRLVATGPDGRATDRAVRSEAPAWSAPPAPTEGVG
jgi:hypothetical protein